MDVHEPGGLQQKPMIAWLAISGSIESSASLPCLVTLWLDTRACALFGLCWMWREGRAGKGKEQRISALPCASPSMNCGKFRGAVGEHKDTPGTAVLDHESIQIGSVQWRRFHVP